MKTITEQRLARRVRDLRQARNMTLQQISELTGLSKALISKIENCLVSPPIATLAKLAEALDVSIGEFFVSNEPDNDFVFFPRGKHKKARGRRSSLNYSYELLAPGRKHRDMQPMLVTIDGKTSKFALLEHPGEQFVYVLEGEMDYVVGDKAYHVRPGDSLYFDAKMLHGPKLEKNQKVRYIVVFSGG